MRELPEHVEPYSRTPVFDEASVPAALLKDHQTKAGTWGVINVLEGKLLYQISGEDAPQILEPNLQGVIQPEEPHFVAPIGAVLFFVEFYR